MLGMITFKSWFSIHFIVLFLLFVYQKYPQNIYIILSSSGEKLYSLHFKKIEMEDLM